MPVHVRRDWTAAEVRALIAAEPLASPRYELVDGELLVTPSPGAPHQALVLELVIALRQYVNAHNVGVAMVSPSDIELEEERIVQPDIYVTRNAEWKRVLTDGFPLRDLLLAVEIVSPSSSRYDRVTKRQLYLRHVPEYWVVDPDTRRLERWRVGHERAEFVTEVLSWQPAGNAPPFEVNVSELFATALLDGPRLSSD